MLRIIEEKDKKVIKNIPSTETGLRTTCYTKPIHSGTIYLITHYPERDRFTLWKTLSDGFEKIATADSPLDFDDIIPWER